MLAPPKPPPDELELLIKEARERQLRRRLLAAAWIAVVAALGFSVYAVVDGGSVKSIDQPPTRGGRATGPLCRASQLSVSAALQGATQSLAGGATLTNTGRGTCSLPPLRPVVRISLHGKTLRLKERPFPYRISPGRPVVHVLMPQEHAVILMQWWNWCGKTGTATMVLRFGRRLSLKAPERLGEPTCIGIGAGRSRLYVSPPFASS